MIRYFAPCTGPTGRETLGPVLPVIIDHGGTVWFCGQSVHPDACRPGGGFWDRVADSPEEALALGKALWPDAEVRTA